MALAIAAAAICYAQDFVPPLVGADLSTPIDIALLAALAAALRFVRVSDLVATRITLAAAILVFADTIYVFAQQVGLSYGWLLDDTFISFVYSRNMAQGHGPVYAVGLPRAQGYTSFLWMAIMAVPHLVHVDVLGVARVVSITALALALLIVATVVWRELDGYASHRWYFSAATPITAICLAPVVLNSMSGMETALAYTLISVFVAGSVHLLRRPSPGSFAWSAFVGLLCGLTRPEANLAVFVTLAIVLSVIPREHRRGLALSLLIYYVAPLALYETAMWTYYGLPLPLPAYIKGAKFHDFPGDTTSGLLPGLPYVLSFINSVPIPFWILAAAGIVKNRRLWPATIGCACSIGYFVTVKPIVAQELRYIVPFTAVFAMLSVLGTAWIVKRLHHLSVGTPGAIAVSILLWISCLSLPSQSKAHANLGIYSAPHAVFGRYLASLHIAGRHVLAMEDAGQGPYFSGWPNIDLAGLNDAWIATHGYGNGYVEHVFSLHPDVIALIGLPNLPIDRREARIIVAMSRLGYKEVLLVHCGDCSPDYILHVFADPKSTAGSVFIRSLGTRHLPSCFERLHPKFRLVVDCIHVNDVRTHEHPAVRPGLNSYTLSLSRAAPCGQKRA